MLAEQGLHGLRRVSYLLSWATTAVAGVSGLVILLFGQMLLRLLFGPGFGRYALVALILAVSFMFATLALGPHLSLKALGCVRAFFGLQAGTTALSLVATVAMASVWGIDGAAGAAVATSAASLVLFVLVLRSAEARQGAGPAGRLAAS